LEACKHKNVAIQKALIRIFGKFEALMHLEGRVDYSDTQKRDMLIAAQKQLLAKISTPYRKDGAGLLLRLDDMGHKLRH
jgi:hypothetical protein